MLSEQNKLKIIEMMRAMKEPMEFKKFHQDEQEYILFLIKNQKGCDFETNGTASDPKTITKFRRI